ncbi:MAG: hypothetical protein AABX90_00275 [Nanoarchaeota archaeon]
MLTDAEKEKIVTIIENMRKQISSLWGDYKREAESNLRAKDYGSELYTNEMIDNMDMLFEKIIVAQKTIDLLIDFLAGKISISEEETLRVTDHSCTIVIKQHEALIKEHEDRRAQIKARLERISLMKSLMKSFLQQLEGAKLKN